MRGARLLWPPPPSAMWSMRNATPAALSTSPGAPMISSRASMASETSLRHEAILELARQHNRVTVDDLAGHFAVSVQTIRKDLNQLCDQRLLTRVHGGATLPSGVENLEYEARRRMAAP